VSLGRRKSSASERACTQESSHGYGKTLSVFLLKIANTALKKYQATSVSAK